MFSQTAEYALRVIVHLASLGDAQTTTRQIAQATKIPEGYLAKVLQSLVRANLVLSQRGIHGGYVLGKPPAEISLYDVISVVDAPAQMNSCPLHLETHVHRLCALHRKLDNVLLNAEIELNQTTIADILDDNDCCKTLTEDAALVASAPAPATPQAGATPAA